MVIGVIGANGAIETAGAGGLSRFRGLMEAIRVLFEIRVIRVIRLIGSRGLLKLQGLRIKV
jgi:hypothetical protein